MNTMTHASEIATASPGRPRGFDEDAVLAIALRVFWEKGYEAASLEALTTAMGINRSSFYNCFGSKHGVLLAALKSYSEGALKRFSAIAEPSSQQTMMALLTALANPAGGTNGCLLVNCITELAPHDPEVLRLGSRHIAQLQSILARKLSPKDPETAIATAGALLALAIGTLTMRKSGQTSEQIEATLQQAERLTAGFLQPAAD